MLIWFLVNSVSILQVVNVLNCGTPTSERLGTRFSGNPFMICLSVRVAKRGTCAQLWRLKWRRHYCSWKVVSLTRWQKDAPPCPCSPLLCISPTVSADHQQPSPTRGAWTRQPRELLHRSSSFLRWQLLWLSPSVAPSQYHSGSQTSQVLGFSSKLGAAHFSASGGLVSDSFSNLHLLTLLFQTFIFHIPPTFM